MLSHTSLDERGIPVRSLLAGAAAIWFVYNAIAFIPQGAGVITNPGQIGGIDGDPAAVAVTWAARTLFVGLFLVSLALVEWGQIVGLFRTPPAGE